jgi:hypothetical protein
MTGALDRSELGQLETLCRKPDRDRESETRYAAGLVLEYGERVSVAGRWSTNEYVIS